MTLILDASVAGKYLVPESDTDKAQALLASWENREIALAAPELLLSEVASLLRKRVLRGDLRRGVASELFQRFEELEIPLHPIRDLAAPALALALRYGHSVYDGLYVALALKTDSELVTADERLYRTLNPSFPQVRLLRDWV